MPSHEAGKHPKRLLVSMGLLWAILTACNLPDARRSAPLYLTATAAHQATLDETPSLTALPVSVTGPPAENTARPTRRPPATLTPEGTPSPTPPFRQLPGGDRLTYPTPVRPPVTPIPPAAQPIYPAEHFTTILLLGSDQRTDGRGNATDTLIVVAVNREANAANMLSIPRDTYVYIPGWTMNRINTAYVRGDLLGTPGGGINLLRETLLYNFGISIDHYARVNFDGFQQIIDAAGGIDVAVDCPLTDWRLISPELDLNDEANWERFTLPVGVHHMNGDLALWYARSRQSTSDFDRNRRQQQILHALWRKMQGEDLLANLPALWAQTSNAIETDMQLGDLVELAPTALEIDASHVRGRGLSEVVSGWRTPDTNASVQLPDLERSPRLVEWLYLEPGVYAVANEASRIEVVNGTTFLDWDVVAAERLGWEGLIAFPAGNTDSPDQQRTQIIDYTGQVKGTSAAVLARVLRVPPEDVVLQPDPNRDVDFRVILGYNYNSCTYR